MNIEICEKRKICVTVTGDELRGYQISFGSMSLRDEHTKVMLRDLISVIEHMGLKSEGDRVTFECAQTEDSGCALIITVGAPGYRFADSGDVTAAMRAGLNICGELVCDGDGYVYTPPEKPSPGQEALLLEFSQPC